MVETSPPISQSKRSFSLPPQQTLEWVVSSIGAGSRVVAVEPLTTGGWHANHGVDAMDREGRLHRLVLRRWDRPEWVREDPDFTVGREVTALDLLSECSVPTPQVVAADPEAAHNDVPALLVTRLPGGPPPSRPEDMSAFVGQLAGVLPPIHAVDGRAEHLIPSYRTYEPIPSSPPAGLATSTVWERAFEVASGPAPQTATMFIHRDFHPGNTLWDGGRLTGVVDWTQASWGSPGLDVGWIRWNLAVDHGRDAAEEFLRSYESLIDAHGHHPYWDVLTVVDLVAAMKPPDLLRNDLLRRRLQDHVRTALALL